MLVERLFQLRGVTVRGALDVEPENGGNRLVLNERTSTDHLQIVALPGPRRQS